MRRPDESRSPEELLEDLETLDEQVRRKVEILRPDIARRYPDELAPRLEEIRKLVAHRSPIARNAAEDAIIRFREFLITAAAPMISGDPTPRE